MLFYLCFFLNLCILFLGFVIVFFIIVFIYFYCIIRENLPDIGRYKLVRAVVVFCN